MHSTSRPAAAGRSSGASKETPNGCWKKMAPLHQLEANTFMPGSPSPGSDLSEFFEEFEDRSLICWCGSSKNSFWTTSEWWKLYVMSTFQWRLPSVHGVAKVVNTVARLPGNADSHELRILQLLTWWCWERSPTRQSFHQIMEGNKHTHTPIHYCLRSSEALVHGVIGVFEICIANSKVLQPLWSLPSWILRPICQLVGIEIRLRHHRSSAHYSFGSQSRCWGHLGLDLAVPGWDVGVYWTDNENAFEPWQTTSQPLLKLLLFSDSSRSCGL